MSVNTKKLDNVILYFASNPGVTKLGVTKLYKLIFFSDAFHMREHGCSITQSEYIKYPHGPVPSRGEKEIKKLKRENLIAVTREVLDPERDIERFLVTTAERPNMDVFSQSEIAVLKSIVSHYGKKSAVELSEISHREPSWVYAGMQDKLSPELMLYGNEEDPDGL